MKQTEDKTAKDSRMGDYWECRKCGLHNKPSNKFCSECGAKLGTVGMKVNMSANIIFLFLVLLIIFVDINIMNYLSSPSYNFNGKPLDVKVFFKFFLGSVFTLLSISPLYYVNHLMNKKIKEVAKTTDGLTKQEAAEFRKQNRFIIILTVLVLLCTLIFIILPIIWSLLI